MGIFRKRTFKNPIDRGSKTVGKTFVSSSKSVTQKGSKDTTVFVETKLVDVEEYASKLSLPSSEDYQLQDLIKSGNIPEEVPVSGMLDSNDSTDLSNQGVGNAILDKLTDSVKASEPTPEPTTEPTTNE